MRSRNEPASPRRRGPAVLLTAGALGLALLIPATGEAAPPPAAERVRELEQIRGEIAGLQARLDQMRVRERSLDDELATLDVDLALREQRIAEAITAQELLGVRIRRTEEEVAALQSAEADTRRRLRGSLQRLYRMGRGGTLRLALSISSGDELFEGLRLLRFVTRRDAAAYGEFLRARTAVRTRQDALAAQRQRLTAWIENERGRRHELAAVRAERARVLRQVEGERASLAGRSRELEQREQRLANLVDLLYGRSTGPLAGRPIQDFQGVLDWPVEGRITIGFGPRRDERYQTLTPHNGVELSTAPGSPVRAIYAGEVVFAAPFEGYGPTVVVRHPGRVFSVYAGLERTAVGQGAMVSFGQPLGRSGARLYVEIRETNRPVDPRTWLR